MGRQGLALHATLHAAAPRARSSVPPASMVHRSCPFPCGLRSSRVTRIRPATRSGRCLVMTAPTARRRVCEPAAVGSRGGDEAMAVCTGIALETTTRFCLFGSRFQRALPQWGPKPPQNPRPVGRACTWTCQTWAFRKIIRPKTARKRQ